MILNIYGGGGSGKTTLLFELLRLSGFVNLVPYTTRASRPGEINGLHYHFISGFSFLNTKLVLKRYIDGEAYGVILDDLRSLDIVISTLSQEAILELERMNIDSKIVYLNVKESVRIFRMLSRGDNYDAVIRRIMIDRKQICTPKTKFPVFEIKEMKLEDIVSKVVDFCKT